MASQQHPTMDETGDDSEPIEDDVTEIENELNVYIEPKPDLPIDDKTHDQTVAFIAAFICIGALILILGLNLLDTSGIFGASCGPSHLRLGQCYQPGGSDSSPYAFTPTPISLDKGAPSR